MTEAEDKKGSSRVGVGIGLTVNLGDYESIRYDVYEEASYTDEPGDDKATVFAGLVEDTRNKLYETLTSEIRNFRKLKKSLVSS